MINNLRLMDKPERKVSWIQERINSFLSGFREATGRSCPIPYAQLIGMLSNKANDAMNGWAIVNMESGEIEKSYPEMDVWNEQCEAFFRDEFAATKAGFSFGYFLKQFGTFVKYEPAKKKIKAESKPLTFFCPYCKENVDINHQCPKE